MSSSTRKQDEPFSNNDAVTNSYNQTQQKKDDFGNNKSENGKLNQGKDNVTSTVSQSFIESTLPPKLIPYAQLARLDKPIGTMLLLWPCLWSTAIASAPNLVSSSSMVDTSNNISGVVGAADQVALSNDSFSSTLSFYTLPQHFCEGNVIGDPKLVVLFATGSFLMRGAGCTINDMWDAKYDSQVSRTQSRPLASGALTYPQAFGFLGLQLTGGLAVLCSLPHLEESIMWGMCSMPLVISYPLMKRVFPYPQLVLGMTFNWGMLMGWIASHGTMDWSVILPMYTGCVGWTLCYDTLYAHQDKVDDAKLGLKSTALTFGDDGTKPILYGLAGIATASWMMGGYSVGYEHVYYYMGCATAGSHLAWQIYTADLNNAENLAERFKSNTVVGWIMLCSIAAGNIGEMI